MQEIAFIFVFVLIAAGFLNVAGWTMGWLTITGVMLIALYIGLKKFQII